MPKTKAKPPLVSLYAGPVTREQSRPRVCRTVGELRQALADYPDELPLDDDLGHDDEECTPGAILVWFNIGESKPWPQEKLRIEPNSGTWEGT